MPGWALSSNVATRPSSGTLICCATFLAIRWNTTPVSTNTNWQGRCLRRCCEPSRSPHHVLRPRHRYLHAGAVRQLCARGSSQSPQVGNGAVVKNFDNKTTDAPTKEQKGHRSNEQTSYQATESAALCNAGWRLRRLRQSSRTIRGRSCSPVVSWWAN